MKVCWINTFIRSINISQNIIDMNNDKLIVGNILISLISETTFNQNPIIIIHQNLEKLYTRRILSLEIVSHIKENMLRNKHQLKEISGG